MVARVPDLAGAAYRLVESVEDAGEVIDRHEGAVEGVIAAGGDGTISLVAAALLARGERSRARLPLGVIPLGSGNAFAYGIGLGSLDAAFRAIGTWREECIDVMRTTHPQAPVALVTLSAGVEGRFIADYEKRRARWSRRGASIAAVVGAVRGARARLRLVADGSELCDVDDPCVNAGLYNLPSYAFGWRMWPDADPYDGTGEAVACRTLRSYGRVLRRGLHTARACDTTDPRWARFRTALLESDGPLQADGEPLAPASISVRLDRGALRVLLPCSPGRSRSAPGR
jgi:diacylglycerol kinase family enzyme